LQPSVQEAVNYAEDRTRYTLLNRQHRACLDRSLLDYSMASSRLRSSASQVNAWSYGQTFIATSLLSEDYARVSWLLLEKPVLAL